MYLCFFEKVGRLARHKKHRGNGEAKVKKTKRRTKDIDQIFDDVQPNKIEKVKKEKTELDEDLPGLGQYYCISCARYFMKEDILQEHFKTKSHKRRLKELKTKPWTPEDANLPVDNGKRRSTTTKTNTGQNTMDDIEI